jgi:acetoacetate decarboxylase
MIVRHRYSPFGPYVGVYLGVAAEHESSVVGYRLTGLKDSFPGVVAGRELWGMPLQLGVTESSWVGNVFSFRAGRSSDLPVCELSLQLESRQPINDRGRLGTFVPEAPGYDGAGMRSLVGLDMATDYSRAEAWSARAALTLHRGTPLDDWSTIPVGEIVDSSYISDVAIHLPRGRVLATWS